MRKALSLAEHGIYSTKPNPRVGCVLVKNDQLLGQGWHNKPGEPHAEIMALNDANNKSKRIEGAVAYINLEPCCHHGKTSPCVDALIASKLSKVYVATADPNPLVNGKGIDKLREAGIEVEVGLLEEEAKQLNRGFIQRHLAGRPWITLKIAQSLDGVMVLKHNATGDARQWITGEAARQDVHLLRARSCAVLSGASSISADNSRLNVRLSDTQRPVAEESSVTHSYTTPSYETPLRIALDPQFNLDPQLDFFSTAGPKLWVGTDSSKAPKIIPDDTEVLIMPKQKQSQTNCSGSINLTDLLVKLTDREINELLVESGPRLIQSFLAEGLMDEFIVYIAPCLLRAEGSANNDITFNNFNANDTKCNDHNQGYEFHLVEQRLCGDDLRLTLQPKRHIN
ncbi:MAG: bifunctional diaminohydroxyphosphoribosylaminopyrimidine deaminase/5-amino-6-(5-phosphoribosylamino)uracil reductase RibD [Gammaproteobacteria bacterium]|nr:bifunctional diaminohydroxyphosphoribosylaminopyrimidine deaminase/5-amino-6-(5-phosphoribosylamino)uracil reductase RibD [Gammaproteobacteria bacterium]